MGKINGREVKNPMAIPAPKISSPLVGNPLSKTTKRK